jgi:ArsR family transcriptional regulator
MKQQEAITALAALAQESRLAVFRLLVKRGPEGFTPGDLMERLALPAPTLSFHLKELVRAGLVQSRRESRFLFYSASFERMRGLIGFLTERCCSLAEDECDADCTPVASERRRRA